MNLRRRRGPARVGNPVPAGPAILQPGPGDWATVRRSYGISVEGMARAVGVGPDTIKRWEAGTHAPRGDQGANYLALLADLARLRQQGR